MSSNPNIQPQHSTRSSSDSGATWTENTVSPGTAEMWHGIALGNSGVNPSAVVFQGNMWSATYPTAVPTATPTSEPGTSAAATESDTNKALDTVSIIVVVFVVVIVAVCVVLALIFYRRDAKRDKDHTLDKRGSAAVGSAVTGQVSANKNASDMDTSAQVEGIV